MCAVFQCEVFRKRIEHLQKEQQKSQEEQTEDYGYFTNNDYGNSQNMFKKPINQTFSNNQYINQQNINNYQVPINNNYQYINQNQYVQPNNNQQNNYQLIDYGENSMEELYKNKRNSKISLRTLIGNIRSNFRIDNYYGESIAVMIKTGYMGITPFLKAHGFIFEDWERTQEFENACEETYRDLGIPRNTILIHKYDCKHKFINNGNNSTLRETDFDGHYIHPSLIHDFFMWCSPQYKLASKFSMLTCNLLQQQIIEVAVNNPSIFGIGSNTVRQIDDNIFNKRLFNNDHILFEGFTKAMHRNRVNINPNSGIIQNIYNQTIINNIQTNNNYNSHLQYNQYYPDNQNSTIRQIEQLVTKQQKQTGNNIPPLTIKPEPKPKRVSALTGSVIIYKNPKPKKKLNNNQQETNEQQTNEIINQTINNQQLQTEQINIQKKTEYAVFTSNDANYLSRARKIGNLEENTILKIFCDNKSAKLENMKCAIKSFIKTYINGYPNQFTLKNNISENEFINKVSEHAKQNGGIIEIMVTAILSQSNINNEQINQQSMFYQPIQFQQSFTNNNQMQFS